MEASTSGQEQAVKQLCTALEERDLLQQQVDELGNSDAPMLPCTGTHYLTAACCEGCTITSSAQAGQCSTSVNMQAPLDMMARHAEVRTELIVISNLAQTSQSDQQRHAKPAAVSAEPVLLQAQVMTKLT